MTQGIQSPGHLVEGLEILWGNTPWGLRATMRQAKSSPLPDSAPK